MLSEGAQPQTYLSLWGTANAECTAPGEPSATALRTMPPYSLGQTDSTTHFFHYHSSLEYCTHSTRQSNSNSDCLLLVQTIQVPQSSLHVIPPTNSHPQPSRSVVPMQRRDQTSQSTCVTPLTMVFGWASALKQTCSLVVQKILSSIRKNSTRRRYQAKWEHFSSWAQ